jgi:hypothetical protein
MQKYVLMRLIDLGWIMLSIWRPIARTYARAAPGAVRSLKIPVANPYPGDTFRAPYAKTDCETQNKEGGRQTL